jgi:competence protein ComEC
MHWWVLKKRVHVSWIITIYCFSMAVGVYLSQFNNQFFSICFLIISAVLLIIACYKNIIALILIAIIGGLLLGLWRGSLAKIESYKYNEYIGQKVEIIGTLKIDPDISESGKSSIQLKTSHVNKKQINGDIWITMFGDELRQGDEIFISGVLLKGFGNYNGTIYGAKLIRIINTSSMNWLSDFKIIFSSAIEKAVGKTQAKLAVGFLLGQKRALSADMVSALQAVGLTHIVVASGYNLTILVRLARRLFEKNSKYLSALASVIMIVFFIMITGISPSMSRAGFVALVSLLAWYYGRKFHPITLLAMGMAVTLLFRPNYIWGDIGWQLSFAAFAGVMIVAPLIQRYLFGDKKPGNFWQILGETVAAQIATLPIIILAFGQISNIAVLANVFVLPFVPLVMLLSFVAGVGGLIFPNAAFIVGFPAKIILDYMIFIVEKMSYIPWAINEIDMTNFAAIIYYLLLAAICLYLMHKTKYKLREVNLVE